MASTCTNKILNPLLLHLSKMQLEVTCPVCVKLMSEPMMLPCCHAACRTCATTQTMNENDYSCAMCALAYRSEDLKPALHLEGIVNILRSLDCTVTNVGLMIKQGSQADTSGSVNVNHHNLVGSKLVHNESTGPDKVKVDDVGNKAKDQTVEPMVLVQKGPCGSKSSDGPVDLDCDSNDLEGELITATSPQSVLKRVPNVTHDHTRKLKRQKSTGQSEKQPTMSGAWKCVLCHSSEISECTGPLLHYLLGELVGDDQASKSNVLHVHGECIVWAPRAYITDGTVKNLEAELYRASTMICSVCGLKGAAVGCFVDSCRKSFHLPCAHRISGCRWDKGNFVMLCASHSSKRLPCEISESKNKIQVQRSPSKSKNKKIQVQRSPSKSKNKKIQVQRSPSKSKNKKIQVQRSPSETMLVENSPPIENNGLLEASRFLTSEWMICGSGLSRHGKEFLDQFGRQTGITVTNDWSPNVTHVVANTNEDGASSRTLKILMAILTGKWVVNVNWLKACLKAREPVSEEPYEIRSDIYGSFDGPRKGRLRAVNEEPSLFSGLTFYFVRNFDPTYKAQLADLIATAGGSILGKANLSCTSLILYNTDPPQIKDQDKINLAIKKRKDEAEKLAAKIGCRSVPHGWLLDAIASCTVQFPISQCT
ncbi:hypothetical protein BRADI_5g15500v3 [Brachypodium distachyon]|uniref:RING-type E3 ubiquitin transferase BRCA1 n=1 Tax=Brachypodium distachyon TaxID=15368 RepID=A0A0Q3P410_BRADI|nr:hypothetical protein BRADI_5g15500v3 [Brachypodium distachyon]